MYRAVMLMVLFGPSVNLFAAVPFEGQWLNNPFEPGGLADGKASNGQEEATLVLNGLLVSPARRQATINGQFVREGDTVLGQQVERILPDRVILRRGDKRLTLQSPSSGLRKK